MTSTNAKERVLIAYRYYERLVVLILLGMLMIVVCYATLGLLAAIGTTMYEKLQARDFHLALPAMHEVFAGFLTLLIGLELMKTIAMYLEDHLIHVEVVLTVAMIAIARHAIDVDYKTAPSGVSRNCLNHHRPSSWLLLLQESHDSHFRDRRTQITSSAF